MSEPPSRNDTTGLENTSTIRCIVAALRENFALLVAGSLAYSAFMSVLPLLTLSFALSTAFGGTHLVDEVLSYTGQYLVPMGQTMFVNAMRDETGRAATSIISVALLIWSGLRVFRTLDSSFSMFYNTTDSKSIVGKTRDSVLVLVAFGVALVSSIAIPFVASLFPVVPMGWALGPVLLFVPLTLAFLPIYYVFPDTDVSVREVLPGVLVTAVGWSLLPAGFNVYTTYAGQSRLYGTLGAVLLVLTWLYAAGLLILVGIAVNVVLGGRTDAALSRPPSRSDIV